MFSPTTLQNWHLEQFTKQRASARTGSEQEKALRSIIDHGTAADTLTFVPTGPWHWNPPKTNVTQTMTRTQSESFGIYRGLLTSSRESSRRAKAVLTQAMRNRSIRLAFRPHAGGLMTNPSCLERPVIASLKDGEDGANV